MIRNDVRQLNHGYKSLAATSRQIAVDGIHLSDNMIHFIDDILSTNGQGENLRGRIREMSKACDLVTRSALSLQEKFALFKETLQHFSDDLSDARTTLRKKSKDHGWWRVCFGVLCGVVAIGTVAATLSVGLAGLGVLVSTPGGFIAVAGLKITANAAAVGCTVLGASFATLCGYLGNSECSVCAFGPLTSCVDSLLQNI